MNQTEEAGPIVLVADADGVRTITLNRPDRLNALASPIMSAFADAVADAARDPDVGCVVVTGAGRGFCAGGDIKGGGDPVGPVTRATGGGVEQHVSRLRGFMEAARLLHDMAKPTIAMVNGPVAGAGIGIAGACDLRFAGESATFVSAFDRIGGSGDFGASWFWTKIAGTAVAREIMLLSEKMTARQAFDKGLYTRLFPDAELREATMTAARRLAGGPRIAYRYMKANLNLAEHASFTAALDHEALNMVLSTGAARAIARAERQAGDG